MADELPTWAIAVAAVSGALLLILFIVFICKCCCRNQSAKTFRWIEKLGIPQAKEGQPTDEELDKEMKLRVTFNGQTTIANGTLTRTNRSYDDDDDVEAQETHHQSRKISEFEEPEPFKRLNHLGIPRAQLGTSPAGSRRAPSLPLPSPDFAEEESDLSSDEDISSIQQ